MYTLVFVRFFWLPVKATIETISTITRSSLYVNIYA